jgi:integrase
MFGSAMAEIHARTGDDMLTSICQDAMGHASLESTLIYFNLLPETKRKLISEASKRIFG